MNPIKRYVNCFLLASVVLTAGCMNRETAKTETATQKAVNRHSVDKPLETAMVALNEPWQLQMSDLPASLSQSNLRKQIRIASLEFERACIEQRQEYFARLLALVEQEEADYVSNLHLDQGGVDSCFQLKVYQRLKAKLLEKQSAVNKQMNSLSRSLVELQDCKKAE